MNSVYDGAISYLQGAQSGVHGLNREVAQEYMVEMLDRIVSMYNVEDFTADISGKELLSMIFGFGKICAFSHATSQRGESVDKSKIFFTTCATSGDVDAYHRPSVAVVENVAVYTMKNILYSKVNSELLSNFLQTNSCCLFHFNALWDSVWRFIGRFAIQLALIDSGIDVNLYNSKVCAIFEVEDQKESETEKYLYDQITAGKPAVFVRKRPTSEGARIVFNNVKTTYIADELSIEKTRIWNDFNTTIGYPNSNSEKRERLISAEVESNTAQTKGLRELWLSNLNSCAEIYNSLFRQNIKFTLNSDVFGGGDEHVQ